MILKTNMSRILVETTVKTALKNIHTNPERGIRNLVDMALQYSNGQFQKRFFSTIQHMLQNEYSAYYQLLREVISHTNTELLYHFGMTLGYNACVLGARQIRVNEQKMQCTIPWALSLQIEPHLFQCSQKHYQALIKDGENLGIYAWLLFVTGSTQPVLALAKQHPDSAFFLFCEPETLNEDILDELSSHRNLMLVFRYNEYACDLCPEIQRRGLLYAVWHPYEQRDIPSIINGDLFYSTQELSPLFTVLIPTPNCSPDVQQLVQQTIKQIRAKQTFRTLPLEIPSDDQLVNTIISANTCPIFFDQNGDLRHYNVHTTQAEHNFFQQPLAQILASACPVTTS